MTDEKLQQDIPGNLVNVETIPMQSQNTIADQFLQALGLSAGTTTIHGAGRSPLDLILHPPQFSMDDLGF